MAKKTDLAGLVGGIIGKPAPGSNSNNSIPHGDESPRNNSRKPAPFRATFVCDPELIRKIKYIGLASGRMHKDVITSALSEYIAAWEQEHGTIVLPPSE